MLTAREGTRFYEGLMYLEPLIGDVKYKWWTSGPVPDGPPAYAINKPPPSRETVRNGGVFCAGVVNLMLRTVGKRVPTYGDPNFDGGTLAYREYFRDYSEPFNLSKAKTWARDTRSGVLIGRPFKSSLDQGHVAIVLPSGYVLQSFDGGGGWPGLNWSYTIEESHNGWYYTWMTHPSNYINYSGDEF